LKAHITGMFMAPRSKRDVLRRVLALGAGLTTSGAFSKLLDTDVSFTEDVTSPALPWLAVGLPALPASIPGAAPGHQRSQALNERTGLMGRLCHWPKMALKLIVKYQQNPLRASRMLAYLHVGLHDGWILGQAPSAEEQALACAETAAHRSASLILEHFFPNETAGYFAAQFAFVESGSTELSPAWRHWAQAVGMQIAQNLIERSMRDGAGRVWPIRNRQADFPGIWQPTYPLYAVNPAEGFAGQWQPWIAPDPRRYQPPKALAPNAVDYQRETAEVLTTARNLTADQKTAALTWNLEAGSVTPAGVWIKICLEQFDQLSGDPMVVTTSSIERVNTALSLLSAVSVVMHDAFIACWHVKFSHWSERPITAVRRTLDAGFVPLLVTPGFPSYVSGHATISAAAAGVLAEFFPDQAPRFADMATEAAESRLWGGIHFRSDNAEGLKLGASVGRDVLLARGRPRGKI
jgi:PAP2 superfamily